MAISPSTPKPTLAHEKRLTLASVKTGRQAAPMRIVIYGVEKIGKAQPIDAGVLTPSGFLPIGNLKVGDIAISATGKPCKVIGVYPQGVRPVFRVNITDGGYTECCDEHLWFTETGTDKAKDRPGKVRSLAEIRETIDRPMAACHNGRYPMHRLPVVGRVEFAEGSSIPLHPYLLGALLGDGVLTNGCVTFHKPEVDVQDRLASLLPEEDAAVRYANGISLRIIRKQRNNKVSGTRAAIEKLGLSGTDSLSKFIPQRYLLASVEDRVELLRGLCDTDGHVIYSGARVEWSTSSERLRNDMIFLARSLGGIVACSTRTPHYTSHGERLAGAPSHRMTLLFPDGLVPVSSAKHLARWTGPRTPHYRSIESIEPVGEKECVCIRVDTPDSLYVTDDFIVTHNSTIAAGAPSTIFLGPEDGWMHLDVAHFAEPRDWQDILDALMGLLSDPHAYQTVVIDTLDWIEPLLWSHLCASANLANIEAFGYGKGYARALDEWRYLVSLFERLRRERKMGIILLAHAQVKNWKNPEGPDFDRYTLKIHDKAAGLLKEWCDAVLFANYQTFAIADKEERTKRVKGISTGARLLYTQRTAAYDAGNRYDLPPELPLNWEDLDAAIRAGRPASPEALRAAIEEKLAALKDEALEKQVHELMEKAGDNAATLAKFNDRLNAKVAQRATEKGE